MKSRALLAGAALVVCGLASTLSAQTPQRAQLVNVGNGDKLVETGKIVNVRDVERPVWQPNRRWLRSERHTFRGAQRGTHFRQGDPTENRRERIRRHRLKQRGQRAAQPEWLDKIDLDSLTPAQKRRVRRALAD